ncbi:MAG: carbohydrate ABC transporter permease [Acidimicrobiia bacterium]
MGDIVERIGSALLAVLVGSGFVLLIYVLGDLLLQRVFSDRTQAKLRPWLWVGPTIILLAVFLVYPVIDTVRRSFLDDRSQEGVGFENYEWAFTSPEMLNAFRNNLFWLVIFTVGVILLAIGIAVLADRVRYESAVKSTVFLPMAISFVGASVIWRFVYEFRPEGAAQIGIANAVLVPLAQFARDAETFFSTARWVFLFLGIAFLLVGYAAGRQAAGRGRGWTIGGGVLLFFAFGLFLFYGFATWEIPVGWLVNKAINNFALIGVGIWVWVGFAVVILSAAIKNVPEELLEAARVDGATEWTVFRRVTIPMIKVTIAVVTTTMVINVLKVFDIVFVMTNGNFDTEVLANRMYKEMFNFTNFGRGAAVAVILFLAVVPVMVWNIRRFREQELIR